VALKLLKFNLVIKDKILVVCCFLELKYFYPEMPGFSQIALVFPEMPGNFRKCLISAIPCDIYTVYIFLHIYIFQLRKNLLLLQEVVNKMTSKS